MTTDELGELKSESNELTPIEFYDQTSRTMNCKLEWELLEL